MPDLDDSRGILYPAELPIFHREPAPTELHGLVRWFWIPRWHLPPGSLRRQRVLPFPACNLVVEPDGVSLVGPSTRVTHRALRGRGWAVGALLRPAATASLSAEPRTVRDGQVPVDAPDLHRAVVAAMALADETAARRRAVAACTQWLTEHLTPPDGAGRQANAMEELIAGDRTIVRVDAIAQRLGISVRGVQRLAQRYVGLTPLAMIRRYRLQEAAQRLREDPTLRIAQVAADLGYADHAHLSADFRDVLGFAPNAYRHGAGRTGPHE